MRRWTVSFVSSAGIWNRVPGHFCPGTIETDMWQGLYLFASLFLEYMNK